MNIQKLKSKEPIVKLFYTWLFDDEKITNKDVNLQSDIDLSLAPFYFDPNIYYPKQIADFFETSSMKRLGRITQMALSINQHPNVCHTRLEHSKGTYNRKLEEFLVNFENPEWKKYIEDNNLKIYLLAELIKLAGHDIGHFPLSHVFEENVFYKHGIHETIGKRILLEDKEIQTVLFSISPYLHDTLKELFEKDVLNFSSHDEGNFDVDRLDYIGRDSLYIGKPFHTKTLPYKSVYIKTTSSGIPIKNDDLSIVQSLTGTYSIDVYDYTHFNYIEQFLKTRFNNYKNAYMSKQTKIAENAIKALMCALLSEKNNAGSELYNYIKKLQSTDINNIDLNEFLKWDDISFFSQIIEIAQNHENKNVRDLATMVIPTLEQLLTILYHLLNVRNSHSYSESDLEFLKTIKSIIKGNDKFSKDLKNPRFLNDNTLIVDSNSSLYRNINKRFIHDFTFTLNGYDSSTPLYIKDAHGRIFELHEHPDRTIDWEHYNEKLVTHYIYIPYLRFINVSENTINQLRTLLGAPLNQSNSEFLKGNYINMQPLQVGHKIEDCFLNL